jgi:hypothetical protein
MYGPSHNDALGAQKRCIPFSKGQRAEEQQFPAGRSVLARAENISWDGIPQVSVVAVSRNDDHGGDMLSRMQHFVNGVIAQCRKHELKAELILVEWNPPPGRPALEEVLEWPQDFEPVTVKIVTVPPGVHAQFPDAEKLPLFQMIGKNVGIRRARGRYVLATNVDILLDDETVIYLRDRLTPGTVLRVDRYDVPGDLNKGVSFDQVLAECQRRFFQINTRFGTLDVRRRRFVGSASGIQWRLLALYTEIRIFGPGDPLCRIMEGLRDSIFSLWQALRRSAGSGFAMHSLLRRTAKAVAGIAHYCLLTVRIAPGQLHRNAHKLWPLRTLPGRSYWYVRRTFRRIETQGFLRPLRGAFWPGGRLVRALLKVPQVLKSVVKQLGKGWRLMGPPVLYSHRSAAERRFARSQQMHTNACGDFTLLARDDWFRLRGYPEWPIFSWHVDSVFLFAVDANDIRQTVLDPRYRIFHIDHSAGSGWSPEGAAQLFARLDSKGIPYLSDEDVLTMRRAFAEDPSAGIVNDENWGFGAIELPEYEVTPGTKRARNSATVDSRSQKLKSRERLVEGSDYDAL